MNDMKYITINKNRGWRGLVEVDILNEEHDLATKHIFSFSQDMWEDLVFYQKIKMQQQVIILLKIFINTQISHFLSTIIAQKLI